MGQRLRKRRHSVVRERTKMGSGQEGERDQKGRQEGEFKKIFATLPHPNYTCVLCIVVRFLRVSANVTLMSRFEKIQYLVMIVPA